MPKVIFSITTPKDPLKRTHNGETPLSYSQWPKSFYYQSSRKMHLITHARNKPFSFKECLKTFSYASSMKTTVRTHTGEKNI